MTPSNPPPHSKPGDSLPEDRLAEADDDDFWLVEHQARTARAQVDLRRDQDQEEAKLRGGRGSRWAPREVDLLVAELARDLVAAGFSLHDCAARASTGGVCLTPLTPPLTRQPEVAVSWTTHDALRSSLHKHAENRRVHDVMNRALADVLTLIGWPVTPHGDGGASCVTRPPRPAPSAPTLFDPGDQQ